MEWITSALLGALCAVSLALALRGMRTHDAALARLRRVAEGNSGTRRAAPGWLAALWARCALLLEKLFPAETGKRGGKLSRTTRQRLIEAGFRRSAALPAYLGSRLAMAAAWTAASIPISLLQSQTTMKVAVIAVAAGLGYTVPGFIVDAKRSSRQRTIVRSLPDAIDLMVVCVEAGLSLPATIDRVAREFARSDALLASELRLAVLETQAGKSLSEALRGLGYRCGVQDLISLTSALTQTERMGTRVADTLRVQADALRTRRLQRAEEIAQKAPVKMLFPAGVFIFPALLAVTLVPAFLGTSKLFG